MKSIGKAILAIIIMAIVAHAVHIIGGVIIVRGGSKDFTSAIFFYFLLTNLYTAIVFFILYKILSRAIPIGGLMGCLLFAVCMWLIASVPEGASEWVKTGTSANVVIGERIEDLVAFAAMAVVIYLFTVRKPKARVVTVKGD